MSNHMTLGRRGEEWVAGQLAAQGWRIVARNWREGRNEADIIAHDPDGVLVVVEVKTRRGTGWGHPVEAVTRTKLESLRGLAMTWLREESHVGSVRVDVVGVLLTSSGPQMRHVRGVGQ